MSTLETAREAVRLLAEQAGLLDADVSVLARPLTPEEAIGQPGRRDFPIIVGKERILEARVGDVRGHAFTDSPRELIGTVRDVFGLGLASNQDRAISVATMNAVMRLLGRVGATVHCRDDEPEDCAGEIARGLQARYGSVTVGLIGLNPAIAEGLVRVFGAEGVLMTDLAADNIGRRRFGVEIWDGAKRTGALIEASDVILATGTTLVNDTFDTIRAQCGAKPLVLFGVTGAAVCEVMGIERLCARGH
jgi:hypothetical protein